MLVSMEPEWLYRFEAPTEATMARIESILRELPVIATSDWRGSQLAKQEGQSGSLQQIMDALMASLKADYQDNLKEGQAKHQVGFPNPPFYFDYVLMRDLHTESGLGIYTRYYTPGESGSIYYGRTVLRETKSVYRLWLD